MKIKIVLVAWLDSEACNDWTKTSDITSELESTHSAGFLVREDDEFILLALSVDPSTESVNSYKKIPRGAIKTIKVLKTLQL